MALACVQEKSQLSGDNQSSSDANPTFTMEMWRVIQQTGKRAVLARGTEQKQIQRPAHMNLKEFVVALPHKSMQSDQDLAMKFPDEVSSSAERAA
ncbi:MAG: hypothetical protein JOZ80_05500 [Acidobacteriaceae bacterium]|jgi:hypothetical protein|nr:hypothetical protein [Acidobacteriaceae bacterium]